MQRREHYNRMTGETNMVMLIKNIEFMAHVTNVEFRDINSIKDPFIRFSHNNQDFSV
jgi:hypothetical protein